MTAIPAAAQPRSAYRAEVRRARPHAQAWHVLVPVDLVAAAAVVLGMLLLGRSARGIETLLFVPAWMAAAAAAGEYRWPGDLSVRTRRLALVALVLPTAMLMVAEVVGYPLSAMSLVSVCFGTALLGVLGRMLARAASESRLRVADLTHRVVVIGPESAARAFLDGHDETLFPRFDVVGVCLTAAPAAPSIGGLPVTVGLDRCHETVAELEADAVILLPDHTVQPAAIQRLRWQLEEAEIRVFVSPGLVGATTGLTSHNGGSGFALLHVRTPRRHGHARWFEDAVERLAAGAALVLLAPLLGVLAVMIRLDSPGPVFFRQTRVGKDATRFTMWKLRTMTCDAESTRTRLTGLDEGAGVLFKIRHDPRITRIGRWLRRTSLDELPQLVNVVLGHMSLVGPRPALPAEVDQYPDDVRRRLIVKPGITGLWQVSGRSDLSWEESVRLDQHYVDNWSLTLDLAILGRTVAAVLRGRGAY